MQSWKADFFSLRGLSLQENALLRLSGMRTVSALWRYVHVNAIEILNDTGCGWKNKWRGQVKKYNFREPLCVSWFLRWCVCHDVIVGPPVLAGDCSFSFFSLPPHDPNSCDKNNRKNKKCACSAKVFRRVLHSLLHVLVSNHPISIILRSRPLSVLDETSQKYKYNPINCCFQIAK